MKQVLFLIALFAFVQTGFAQVQPPATNPNSNPSVNPSPKPGQNPNQAQPLELPPPVRTTFSSAYPKSNDVKWGMENGNYRGEFVQTIERRTAVSYDREGRLIETQMYISDMDLPMAARESLKGKQATDFIQTVDAKGRVKYRATAGDKTWMFDEQGKPLPQ